MAVRETEALELGRTDHLHLHASSAHVVDGVGHEASDDVTWVARIRGREHCDLHELSIRNTAYPSEPSVSCVRCGNLQAAQ